MTKTFKLILYSLYAFNPKDEYQDILDSLSLQPIVTCFIYIHVLS